jgi:hypothetical protein
MQSAPGARLFSGTKTSASSPFLHSSSLGPQVHNSDLSKSTFYTNLALLIAGAAGCGIAFDLINDPSPGDRSLILGEVELILVGPTLVTNLLSTGLITWKAWCALLASDPRRLSLTTSSVY